MDEIKRAVKDKYAGAARQVLGEGGCCGGGKVTGCCGGTQAGSDPLTPLLRDLYPTAEAGSVPAEALQASLGCGNPSLLAALQPGEVVLDLGAGGGIDVLLAAVKVGAGGFVYGVDMTDEMLELARANQARAGLDNVSFLKGEIEALPLPDSAVDVIISNCVINLSLDKDRVLAEAYRVLRPGGRLAVSDMVFTGPVPPELRARPDLWAECVAGALTVEEFRAKLAAAGFVGIDIEAGLPVQVEGASVASAAIRACKPAD